jgi:NitT/TauT family transport system ATP-binding protein
MSRVRVQDLAFSYGQLKVLNNLSFSAERQEVIAFLGPSGCGKTTLLRCIAGFLEPTRGTVEFEHSGGAKGACSFVFQRPTLLPWLTVAENLALPFKLQRRKIPTAHIAEQVQRMGLMGFERNFQTELSVGMAQRVTFARALSEGRKILLLDEPFSALDELGKRDLAVRFSRVIEEDALTVLLVTHSIRDAVFLADQILVLSKRPTTILERIHIPLPKPRAWFGPELLLYAQQAQDALEKSS